MTQNYIQVHFKFLSETLTDKALWRGPGCRVGPTLDFLNFDSAKVSKGCFLGFHMHFFLIDGNRAELLWFSPFASGRVRKMAKPMAVFPIC